MELVSGDQGGVVVSPLFGRNLKTNPSASEWQRYLDRVMRVRIGRLAGKAYPDAATAPKQDATSCGGFHATAAFCHRCTRSGTFSHC
jgi:hypothetical protein